MKYKVITTFKPDNWDRYAKRMVQSVLDNWTDVDGSHGGESIKLKKSY